MLTLADRSRRQWEEEAVRAATWVRRAAVLGGQDALALAQTRQRAAVTVRWESVMGVVHPVDARVTWVGEDPERLWSNAAVAQAVAAAASAVEGAARTAVVEEAVRRMDAEVSLTRRRLRALDQRWIPQLEDALADLELRLEQAELEDSVRLRHGHPPDSNPGAL